MCNLVQRFPQAQAVQKSISAILFNKKNLSETKGQGGDNGKNDAVEDRYYKKGEYAQLSSKAKQKLHELRKKCKRGDGGSYFSKSSGTQAQISALEAKNSALEAKIAAMGSKQSDGDIDMLDEEDGGKQKGNRNHYALTRQKKKKS